MTIEEAIRELHKISGAIDSAVDDGVKDILNEGLDIARIASSGTLTYEDMRRMDSPYAKRHGVALQPAYIINRHSGQFYEGWRVEGRSLTNRSLHAALIASGGSTRSSMLRRPVDVYVATEMRRASKRMIESRIQRVVA